MTPTDISRMAWVSACWIDQWIAAEPSRLHHFIEDPLDVPGQDLPCKTVDNNCLRTGVGHYGTTTKDGDSKIVLPANVEN